MMIEQIVLCEPRSQNYVHDMALDSCLVATDAGTTSPVPLKFFRKLPKIIKQNDQTDQPTDERRKI